MRTVIVGDVHGCLDELLAIAARCGDPADTRYVMVGDLVAKGPDSQGVLQWARESGAQSVLGNHDAHVLHVRKEGTDKEPKVHHVAVARTLTPADWDWLEARPLWLSVDAERDFDLDREDASHLVVHAGVVPGVPMDRQERAHLLNMRSINAKGLPTKKIEGDPWASRWHGPPHIVFGHDAVRGLQQHKWATGLDTGCVYGRELSALVLPEGKIVTVSARRAYAPMNP